MYYNIIIQQTHIHIYTPVLKLHITDKLLVLWCSRFISEKLPINQIILGLLTCVAFVDYIILVPIVLHYIHINDNSPSSFSIVTPKNIHSV